VVVVQSDAFNRSRIGTIVAVTLTSNLELADAPGNLLVRRKETGLPKDSVVNVSQIVTLDRRLLTGPCGRLSPRAMKAVEDGLRLALSL
jgi:mRNA interferase MazF